MTSSVLCEATAPNPMDVLWLGIVCPLIVGPLAGLALSAMIIARLDLRDEDDEVSEA